MQNDKSKSDIQLPVSNIPYSTIVNVLNKLTLNACHSERSEES